jgi:hypothetical protein
MDGEGGIADQLRHRAKYLGNVWEQIGRQGARHRPPAEEGKDHKPFSNEMFGQT